MHVVNTFTTTRDWGEMKLTNMVTIARRARGRDTGLGRETSSHGKIIKPNCTYAFRPTQGVAVQLVFARVWPPFRKSNSNIETSFSVLRHEIRNTIVLMFGVTDASFVEPCTANSIADELQRNFSAFDQQTIRTWYAQRWHYLAFFLGVGRHRM